MRNFSSELLFSTSQKAEKANFRNVIYLAICYMALFAPYYAGMNLMTQVFRQLGFGDLGKICYFVIVTGSAVGNILASHIAKDRSPLILIKFCAFLNIFFLAAGVLATYCSKNGADTGFCSRSFLYFINISTGFVSGVAQAFLWICQGVYLYSCTNKNNKGLFTGTFQAIFQACQIVSGMLSAVILGYTDQFVFYMILFVIMVTSVGMFKFTKPAVKYEDPKSQQETSIHVTDTETLGEYLTKFKDVITDKRYKFLHQFAIFFGTGSAFIPVFLGTAVTIAMDTNDTALINRNTGLVVVVMAVGAIIGSFMLGKISDQYEDKMKLLNPTLVLFEAALIITLLGCIFKSLFLVFICSFLWGCGEAGIMTIAWIIIGAKFNANPLLFAAFRFISKMSGVLIIMLTIVLPGFLWSLGIISATFLTFHFLVYQSKKQLEGKKSVSDSLNCSLLVEMKVLNSQ